MLGTSVVRCPSALREPFKPAFLYGAPPVSERESEVVFFPFCNVKAGSSPDLFGAHALRLQLKRTLFEFMGVVHRVLGAIEHARIPLQFCDIIA